jgi:hypothetical protein
MVVIEKPWALFGTILFRKQASNLAYNADGMLGSGVLPNHDVLAHGIIDTGKERGCQEKPCQEFMYDIFRIQNLAGSQQTSKRVEDKTPAATWKVEEFCTSWRHTETLQQLVISTSKGANSHERANSNC